MDYYLSFYYCASDTIAAIRTTTKALGDKRFLPNRQTKSNWTSISKRSSHCALKYFFACYFYINNLND